MYLGALIKDKCNEETENNYILAQEIICVTRNTKIKAGYEKNKKKNVQNSITTYSTLWILNRMPQKKNL